MQHKMSSQRALNHISQTKIFSIPGKLGGLAFQILGLVGLPLVLGQGAGESMGTT